MFKQALRSYIASLHPRNLKKVNNDSFPSASIFVFWMAVYPTIVGYYDTELHWLTYLFYMFVKFMPALLMAWSNMCGRLPMPKMMYVAPMKEEERYDYIKSLLIIKIGVPILLSLILQLIWKCFYDLSILQMMVILFAYMSIGIGCYVCSDLVNRYGRKIPVAKRDKNGEPREAWLNVVEYFIGMVLLIALESTDFMGLDRNEFGTSTYGIVVFIVLLMLLGIGNIVILRTRYQDTLENLCNYEITHRVLGKVKNV